MNPLKWLSQCKNRLTKISEREPLSKFSFFLVLLFDVFLFIVVMDGLGKMTSNVDSPESYAGYECRSMIETTERDDEISRRDALFHSVRQYQSYRKYDSYSSYGSYGPSGGDGFWTGCETLREAVARARWGNKEFARIDEEMESIEKQLSANSTEQITLRSNYDTKLLEKIADQPEDASIMPGTADSAKADLSVLTEKENALKARKEALIVAAMKLPEMIEIQTFVNTLGKNILITYEQLSFWFPVKVFGVQLLFLLPVFAAGIFWVRLAIVRGWEIQTLVASHVLAVLSIFGMAKAVSFIIDILPHKFIAEVIALLESLHLLEIWYYVIIVFGIATTLGLVYFVQKKILHRARLEAKRAGLGQCTNCAVKLQEGSEFCPNCGTARYVKCGSCKKETLAGAIHCVKCGAETGNVSD